MYDIRTEEEPLHCNGFRVDLVEPVNALDRCSEADCFLKLCLISSVDRARAVFTFVGDNRIRIGCKGVEELPVICYPSPLCKQFLVVKNWKGTNLFSKMGCVLLSKITALA